jgi:hypothetical protein
MNCKQVHELLPLFVGHDLEDSRARQVAAHVQECAHCAGAADEYRETRQMMQQFSPPQFSEGVYAAMRQRVWREIEADSTPPALSRFVIGWFRPRLGWAAASVLLIALALSVIYLIANRIDRRQLVVKVPHASHEQTGTQPAREQQAPLTSSLHDGRKDGRPTIRPRRNYQKVVSDRADAIAPKTSSASPEVSSKLNNSTESVSPSGDQSATPLRMEWQTKDPNIRIIWFSRPDTTRVSNGSKGI